MRQLVTNNTRGFCADKQHADVPAAMRSAQQDSGERGCTKAGSPVQGAGKCALKAAASAAALCTVGHFHSVFAALASWRAD